MIWLITENKTNNFHNHVHNQMQQNSFCCDPIGYVITLITL